VFSEIKTYGHEEQKKKLIAGIVITGGGSQLKHIKQLTEYITGMDTRIGYPNEHLAGDSNEQTTSPLYATAVGLVMNAVEVQNKKEITKTNDIDETPQIVDAIESETITEEEIVEETITEKPKEEKKNYLQKWSDRFRDFLDTAE
jgi:cell division protein FtsA